MRCQHTPSGGGGGDAAQCVDMPQATTRPMVLRLQLRNGARAAEAGLCYMLCPLTCPVHQSTTGVT